MKPKNDDALIWITTQISTGLHKRLKIEAAKDGVTLATHIAGVLADSVKGKR